jgi:L-fuculose-phosphate aldolase
VRHRGERELLKQATRDMTASGLVLRHGTSGNASVRIAGGFLITPTGVPYGEMRLADMVELTGDGTPRPGQLAPSSEWRFHRDIYRSRPEAGAIVHAHPLFATALACSRRSIPAVHYMVALAGADSIRCAEYATYGTAELSRNALAALDGRKACLLANHGMIAFGEDMARALTLAVEVEHLAAQYWHAAQVGDPVVLGAKEMRRVRERFSRYGQQPRTKKGGRI